MTTVKGTRLELHFLVEGTGEARVSLVTSSAAGADPVVWTGWHPFDADQIREECDDLARATRRAARHATTAGISEVLAGHGRVLFDLLLPSPVKARIRATEGGSLVIVSTGGRLAPPWHLLHDGRTFLGTGFATGELWAAGRPRPERPPRPRGAAELLVVADPAGDLPGALQEGETLVKAMARGERPLRCELRAGPLRCHDLLRRMRHARMLHFAGHADPEDETGPSGWRLSDGRLGVAELVTLAGDTTPDLVVANACRSATQATRAIGDALLAAGVRHFIGTTIDLPDLPAADFMRRFYERLQRGATVGEALRVARVQAAESDLVVWTAYRLRGDPDARYFDARNADELETGPRRGIALVARLPDDIADDLAQLKADRAAVGEGLGALGGRLLPGAGGTLRAVFGLPVSYEDDEVRAARAAEVVRQRLGDGGTVVVDAGSLEAEGDDVLGAAFLRAERAAWRLTPGAYVLDAMVRALGGRARLGESATHGAWRLLGVGDRTSQTVTVVGRTDELARLRTAARRVHDDRAPVVVTVRGAAGMGKSTLVAAFLASEGTEHAVAQGAGRPFRDGGAYTVTSALLRGLLRANEGVTAEQLGDLLAMVVRQLDAGIARVAPMDAGIPSIDLLLRGDADEHGLTERLPVLRAMLGLGGDTTDLDEAARTPGLVPLAFREFVQAFAEPEPLVLVFEDLHWLADDDLAVFEELTTGLARTAPVLVLATTRPGFADRARHDVAIELNPLSAEDARTLVRSLGVAAGDADTLVRRAEGNPLFLHELGLAEADGDDAPLPGTIEAVVQARLDRRSPAEREALRAAAVLGRAFWREGLCAILGRSADIDETLRDLQAARFLEHRGASEIAGCDEWQFTHAVVQEAVYRGTSERASRLLHGRAASWLAGLETTTVQPMVARHYGAGGEPRRAAFAWLEAARSQGHAPTEALRSLRAALDADDLADDGFDAPTRAEAETALATLLEADGDLDTAVVLLDAAVARTSEDDVVLRSQRLWRRARAATALGDRAGAARWLAEVLEGVADVEEDAARHVAISARRDLAVLLYQAGRPDDAEAELNAAQTLLRPGEDVLRGTLHNAFGIVADTRGDFAAAELHYRRALAAFEAARDEYWMSNCYGNLGIVSERGGDFDGAIGWYQKAVRVQARRGDRRGLARTYNNLGSLHTERGDWPRARDYFRESVRIKEASGDSGVAVGYANLGEVAYLLGEFDVAQERISAAIALCEEGRGPEFLLPEAYRIRAAVRRVQADATGAVDDSRQALELARAHSGRLAEGVAERALGLALLEVGDDDAATHLERAVDMLDELDNPVELARAFDALALCITESDLVRAVELRDMAAELRDALGVDPHGSINGSLDG